MTTSQHVTMWMQQTLSIHSYLVYLSITDATVQSYIQIYRVAKKVNHFRKRNENPPMRLVFPWSLRVTDVLDISWYKILYAW